MMEQLGATLIQGILRQIGEDLSALIDHDLVFTEAEIQLENERPAGADAIHISFRLVFSFSEASGYGSLLVPLRDAITLAGYLLEIPEAGIESKRKLSTLDTGLKDAIVEIGNMVGGSAATAMRSLSIEGSNVRFEGCQGVRPGVRPALTYNDGAPLIIGRSAASLEPFPDFKVILFLPADGPLGADAAA